MVASTATPGSAYTTGQCAGGRDSRKGYFYPNRPQRACLGRTGDRAWDLDGPRRSHRPRNHLSGCWVEGLSTPSIGPRAFVGLLYRDGIDRTPGPGRNRSYTSPTLAWIDTGFGVGGLVAMAATTAPDDRTAWLNWMCPNTSEPPSEEQLQSATAPQSWYPVFLPASIWQLCGTTSAPVGAKWRQRWPTPRVTSGPTSPRRPSVADSARTPKDRSRRARRLWRSGNASPPSASATGNTDSFMIRRSRLSNSSLARRR